MSLKDIFGKLKRGKNKNQSAYISSVKKNIFLTGDIEIDVETIYRGLGGSTDIMRRKITIGTIPATLVYINGIVNIDVINRQIY